MGFTRTQVLVLLIITVSFLIGTQFYSNRDTFPINFRRQELDHIKPDDMVLIITETMQQRNNISRLLNLKQQKIGQMECEEIAKSINKLKVSSTGGWCEQTSVEHSGEHKTDTKLIPVLADFFKGKHVASFGDGPGRYKQLLLDTGLLQGYDAYDGAPFSEKTSEGRVQYLDLTLPQYGLPQYDWVLSLEVAEHIPTKFESIYLDNIVRHAKVGVVLSWAPQGQTGYSHVNGRTFEYVKNIFEQLGFTHDAGNSSILKTAASLLWLKDNINVYRRKNWTAIEQLNT